ncbi:MAG: DNA-deoxyinosine glycosylase [Clostridia bacterium]|nr:DNA-deoxyinosine glycosylase [Clostridia bacterium]
MKGAETIVVHNIPPVFDSNSETLILGSIPSPKSRKEGFFYAHPQNRLWRILAEVFEEEVPVTIEQKKTFLFKNRIAMWDVLASCDIEGSADNTIKNAVANDFSIIFNTANIRQVFTTGNTAAYYYKKLTGNESVRLPSPSPLNCAVSFEKLVSEYMVLLHLS